MTLAAVAGEPVDEHIADVERISVGTDAGEYTVVRNGKEYNPGVDGIIRIAGIAGRRRCWTDIRICLVFRFFRQYVPHLSWVAALSGFRQLDFAEQGVPFRLFLKRH